MADAQAQATDWLAQAKALEENTTNTWKPEAEGAAVAGRITAIEEHTGQNNDSTLVTIETQDTMPVSIWLSTVLQREWDKLQPKRGDVIAIKYHGMRTASKSGREYKSYTLAVLQRGNDDFEDEIPI